MVYMPVNGTVSGGEGPSGPRRRRQETQLQLGDEGWSGLVQSTSPLQAWLASPASRWPSLCTPQTFQAAALNDPERSPAGFSREDNLSSWDEEGQESTKPGPRLQS